MKDKELEPVIFFYQERLPVLKLQCEDLGKPN